MSCECDHGRLRWSSFILLCLALASWVLALGGIGAVNWMVCTDTQATKTDIATNQASVVESNAAYLQFSFPPVNTEVSVCSRSWRWEWWTLFFQLAILIYGFVVTLLPQRLTRAKYGVAQYLCIADVLIMIALNDNITDVWWFWDRHHLFDEWKGALKKLYMSSAALVAGWILLVIFNTIWIGCILDCDVKKKCEQPATDVEAPQAARK